VDGTTVLNRVLKEGESQRLEARQEVLLSVGDAGGVAVTLNDAPLAPLGLDGEVKRGIAINAQTAPAMLASAGPGAVASPSPRPVVRRPASPRPPSPSPSPSPSVLLLAPRPSLGFGSPGILPPSGRPSPSPFRP
jgi:cytoskeleton protein RodZ